MNGEQHDPTLSSLVEARERLAIGRSAMAMLVRTGQIKVVRVTPRNVRVKPDELENFIAKRTTTTAPGRGRVEEMTRALERNRARRAS